MDDEKCKYCGEIGLHVCIPLVVGFLKNDDEFKKLVKEIVHESMVLEHG